MTQFDAAPPALRFDHREHGLGVSSPAPRLSWLPAPGAVDAYEVEARADDGRVWTAFASADERVGFPWVGPELRSRERRSVRVRAITPDGPDAWSAAADVEAALLSRRDWRASLIEPDSDTAARPVFRRRFEVAQTPQRARLYATFHGIGVIRIDGVRVGTEQLSPGWQSYEHRLAVAVHDVTHLVQKGSHVIEVSVADGWWAGRLGFLGQRALYGDTVGAIVQLEMTGPDGGLDIVATDSTWRWRGGPVLAADLYDGETFDARRELSLDDDVDDPQAWAPVGVRDLPPAELMAQDAPPIRAKEVREPERIFTSPSGRTLVDFGQNLVGWVRLTARGTAGTRITVRHAEVLEDGELGVRPLRTAEATDRWILAGTGEETWEPGFTFHGFRYAEISGWPSDTLEPGDIRAVVVHSDLRRTGWFDTAHTGLRRLHENVVWSMRGNFVSIPTDCPQRDERLGWTGDIAVFAPTATYLYDTTAFLESWLRDLAAEQHDDGVIPYFVPSLPFPPEHRHRPVFVHNPTAVWGDVCTILPFALYDETGDVEVLRRSFPTMLRWLDCVESLAGADRVWEGSFQYGDWLDPSAPPEAPALGATDPALVATAYFAHSAGLAAHAAGLLGDGAARARLRRLHREVVEGFRARFVAPDGRLTSDSQTAYAIGLQLDLLDRPARRIAASRLVELVRAGGHRIGTGFVGTPLILHALTAVGAVDDAYALALQREAPSWLYAVMQGATTVWERWDSMLPDGSINPGEMTSFNHYALGAVASWLHETVGGLSSVEPGWRRLRVAPRPHDEVRAASTAHETPGGRAEVAWELLGDQLRVELLVPDGATAEVDLEGHDLFELGAGRHVLERSWTAEIRRRRAPETTTGAAPR